MANYSSVSAWEMPWTEEPGWSQSTGLQRVENDLATKQQNQQQTLNNKMVSVLEIQKATCVAQEGREEFSLWERMSDWSGDFSGHLSSISSNLNNK